MKQTRNIPNPEADRKVLLEEFGVDCLPDTLEQHQKSLEAAALLTKFLGLMRSCGKASKLPHPKTERLVLRNAKRPFPDSVAQNLEAGRVVLSRLNALRSHFEDLQKAFLHDIVQILRLKYQKTEPSVWANWLAIRSPLPSIRPLEMRPAVQPIAAPRYT
jgi:hypothetical protein